MKMYLNNSSTALLYQMYLQFSYCSSKLEQTLRRTWRLELMKILWKAMKNRECRWGQHSDKRGCFRLGNNRFSLASVSMRFAPSPYIQKKRSAGAKEKAAPLLRNLRWCAAQAT